MTNLLRLCLILLSASCLLSVEPPAFAKDWNSAGMQYGRGVHTYFAGQDDVAEQYLTRAIESNPNDPRAFYFRAMSRLRRGREIDARADMLAGASAEARAPSRYAVGTALERVQGRERLLLENYRRQARLDEATRRDERARTRYEHIIDREPETLRSPVEVPLEELLEPGKPQELIDRQVDPAPRKTSTSSPPKDPFADDPDEDVGARSDTAPQQPDPAVLPPQTDQDDEELFGKPAGDEPTPPDQDAPSEKPSSELDEENPFGDF